MDKYGQVYKIHNKINNKVYIGITVGLDVEKDRYGCSISHTKNLHLKNSILKYGRDNFDIETLYWASSKEELSNKEIEYISKYNSLNDKYGYNMHEGGIGGRMREEVILVIGQKSQEFWDNNPQRKKELAESMMSENNFLVKMGGHTDESKLKMTNSARNRSKFWFVQYDSNMHEINKFYTLRDTYTYMIKNNIESITYNWFKSKTNQEKIFSENLYKGFYWRK